MIKYTITMQDRYKLIIPMVCSAALWNRQEEVGGSNWVCQEGINLRALNDLKMATNFLAVDSIIWLLPHPLSSLSPVGFSSTSDTQEDWERETPLADGRGGAGGRERSQIIRPQKASHSVNHSIISGINTKRYFHAGTFYAKIANTVNK